MKKRLLMAAFMVAAFVPSTLAATFNDVNSNTPYVDDIYWTVNQGITSGYADGSGNWGPDNCVTRAELLKMLMEYELTVEFGLTADKSPNPFTDVQESDWFYHYVVAAQVYDFVEGYADGTFRPNNCVNRVEAMKIALNVLMPYQEDDSGEPMYYDDKTIVDMSHVSWYSKYARPMFEHRIAGTVHTESVPNPDGSARLIKFFPEGDMSRKEVAHMIKRISEVYPSLACESSGGDYKGGQCYCTEEDFEYDKETLYCTDPFGLPGGELKQVYQNKHPLNQ